MITATYGEASTPGAAEFADVLGRTPKRGRRRRVRNEWPVGGVNVRVGLLPIYGELPCQSFGDPDEWVRAGERGAHYSMKIKSACGDCPARARCLAYALKWDVSGIWGGTTSRERERLRRKADLPAPLPVQLGRDPFDFNATPAATCPDAMFLDVAAGEYEARAVERDEREAVIAVRAASAAPTDAPEWDDEWAIRAMRIHEDDAGRGLVRGAIGSPLIDVVTAFGSRIRSVTTDDDGCVTSIDIRH